jgi:hypothetical protein
MSLRIRRGTEAQRTGATFDLGEIVYATDTNKLYVGDGVNAGGKNILATSAGTGLIWNTVTQRLDFNGSGTGIVNVQADATPSLGGNLNLSNRSITGTGNINITGTVTATQFVGTRVVSDTNPNLGGNLNTGAFNITGTGSISAATITTTGRITSNALTVSNGVTVDQITDFANGVTLSSNSNSAFFVKAPTDGTAFNSVSMYVQAFRGTVSAPTNTQSSDILGGYIMSGLTASGYKNAGGVTAQWDPSAVLTDYFPASNLFISSGGSGFVTNVATFDSKGRFNSPRFRVGSWAAGSLIPNVTSFTSSGTSVNTAATYLNVTQTSTSGSGTGAIFTIKKTGSGTAYSGNITVIVFYSGSGYAVGNTIILPGTSLGGTSPANDLTITVGTAVGVSRPQAPLPGEIIFDSSSNHFFGYNGTAWVQFTGP